jgi:hypothetical protein
MRGKKTWTVACPYCARQVEAFPMSSRTRALYRTGPHRDSEDGRCYAEVSAAHVRENTLHAVGALLHHRA